MSKLTRTSTLAWSFVLLSSLSHLASGQRYDTKVIEAGSSFQLVCEAETPVHWCHPEIYATPDLPQDFVYGSPVSVSYSHDDMYRTTLNISNVTSMYTGFYHCAANNTEELCNRKMNSINSTYVYVEDVENLLLVKYFKQISAYKSEKAILPCLKTHPNITVTLSSSGLQVQEGQQEDGNFSITYDPTLGYVLDPMPSKDLSFICTASWGEKTEMLTIDITPTNRKRQILAPDVYQGEKTVTSLMIKEGDSLNLTCYIYQNEEVAYDIKWNFPEQENIEIERNDCYFKGHICKNSTLWVHNISGLGAGNYECITLSPGYNPQKAVVEVSVNSHRSVRQANFARRTDPSSRGSTNIPSLLDIFIILNVYFLSAISRQLL